jgi:hypothetical protein
VPVIKSKTEFLYQLQGGSGGNFVDDIRSYLSARTTLKNWKTKRKFLMERLEEISSKRTIANRTSNGLT